MHFHRLALKNWKNFASVEVEIPDRLYLVGPNAKEEMVTLARQARRDLRADMVPRKGSGRPIGPAYTSRLVEFATFHWRPDVAARSADSLRRAIDCLRRLIAGARS